MKKHILFLYSAIFLYFFAFFVLPPINTPFDSAKTVQTEHSLYTILYFALLSLLLYGLSAHIHRDSKVTTNKNAHTENKPDPHARTKVCTKMMRVIIIGVPCLFTITFAACFAAKKCEPYGAASFITPVSKPSTFLAFVRFFLGVAVFAFYEELLFRAFLPTVSTVLIYGYARLLMQRFSAPKGHASKTLLSNRAAGELHASHDAHKPHEFADADFPDDNRAADELHEPNTAPSTESFKDEATLAHNFRLCLKNGTKATNRRLGEGNAAPKRRAHVSLHTVLVVLLQAFYTVLFALSHRYLGAFSVVHAFLCGLIFVAQTKKTGTVFCACVTHAAYNCIVYAFLFLG